MAMRKDCPKCGASMTEGFIPDESDNGRKVNKWIEGAPEKHWYGLKLRGKTRYYIQTFRCNRCGYLENYALA
jgi:predicted nucleic-acid-binding Zn-ribbon protein